MIRGGQVVLCLAAASLRLQGGLMGVMGSSIIQTSGENPGRIRCFAITRSRGTTTSSGGEQYIHNQKESSLRQEVLHQCFRDSSAAAFRMSGILAQAAASSTSRDDDDDGYHVLEIGCGAGATTLDLARQLPVTAHVVGLDTNADMIAAAQERLSLPENKDLQSRVEFRVLSGEQAAEQWYGSFDAVWMRFVLVHVPQPLELVEAAAECLKPETGILLIEDCNACGYFSNPALYATDLINERHNAASLQMGADVRRGPWIGGYMRQAGNGLLLRDIHVNSFVPMYGKGVAIKPWVETEGQGQTLDDRPDEASAHFALGLKLAEMSLDSLAPKFLELGVCTDKELERARKSLEEVERIDYQVFSFPGGQIFQWWAQRSGYNPR